MTFSCEGVKELFEARRVRKIWFQWSRKRERQKSFNYSAFWMVNGAAAVCLKRLSCSFRSHNARWGRAREMEGRGLALSNSKSCSYSCGRSNNNNSNSSKRSRTTRKRRNISDNGYMLCFVSGCHVPILYEVVPVGCIVIFDDVFSY